MTDTAHHGGELSGEDALKFRVGRRGETWAVSYGREAARMFPSAYAAMAFVHEQLESLREIGRSGVVVFD